MKFIAKLSWISWLIICALLWLIGAWLFPVDTTDNKLDDTNQLIVGFIAIAGGTIIYGWIMKNYGDEDKD
jgi:hypothetical protein